MNSDKQAISTMLFVIGGVVLAVLLAALINQSIPERDTPAVSTGTSSINYAALERGANLAHLERGRIYYAQLCVSCHGVRGDGHGEWSYRVTPFPRDLTNPSVRQRSDAYLFGVISDGLVGTAMTGWKDRLSEQQRWQIVAFLRHLGAQQMQDRRAGA